MVVHGRACSSDISFTSRAGRFLGVVGPNGAGKTTLLRALLGLVPIAAGRIEVLGRPAGASADRGAPDRLRAAALRDRAEVPGARARRRADGASRALRHLATTACARICRRSTEALVRVGIADRAERPIGALSGGEQRRVMLAQALCASERLLVLDEPTIGLDLPAEQDFYALLRDAAARARTRGDRGVARSARARRRGRRAGLHQPHDARARQSRTTSSTATRCARPTRASSTSSRARSRTTTKLGRAGLMFEFAFMQRALVAAVLIGIVCGALGFFVVLRRLAFIGVGISHSAIGGVALGIVLGVSPLATGAAFSIAVALAIAALGRRADPLGGHHHRRLLLGLDGARRGALQPPARLPAGSLRVSVRQRAGRLGRGTRGARRCSARRCSRCWRSPSGRSSSPPSTRRWRAPTATRWTRSTPPCSCCWP